MKDIQVRELSYEGKTARLLYIKTICDSRIVRRELIDPFRGARDEADYAEQLLCFPECKPAESREETERDVLEGAVVVWTDGRLLLFDARKEETAGIREATIETAIQGPQNAFSENLDVSLNMLRSRYHSSSLQVDYVTVGSHTRTKVAVAYDDSAADPDTVRRLKEALQALEVEIVQAAGELHRLLSRRKWSLFPTMMITERPDRAIYNLAQGKVVLALQGSSFVLIVPSVFYDFFSAMDDLYQLPVVSNFLMGLRYLGVTFSLILPSIYVAMVSYNPEWVRLQLALTIAGSRTSVPFPSFLEVLYMLLMMEILTEASVRLPKAIGSTATTVGGLILGQAASEAGLTSNIMIIIVATVAISNFSITINAMSFAMRVTRYVFLLITSMFGLVGLLASIVGLTAYLAHLDSFGKPYFKLFLYPPKSELQNRWKRGLLP